MLPGAGAGYSGMAAQAAAQQPTVVIHHSSRRRSHTRSPSRRHHNHHRWRSAERYGSVGVEGSRGVNVVPGYGY